jgi:hypothetical protein
MIHKTFESLKQHQGMPKTALMAPWDTMELGSGVTAPGLLPYDDTERSAAVADVQRRRLAGRKYGDFALADAVIFLPVVEAVSDRLSPPRAETILHTDIEAMNADLFARLAHPNPPPVVIPAVFNHLLVDSETEDGLHFSEKIMNKQAELLLGWRCNDAMRSQSSKGICCRRFEWTRPVQAMVLFLLVLWAPLGRVVTARLCKPSAFVGADTQLHHPRS